MKIYITRHGETEWNTQEKMQGWSNSNLTEKGIENAKKLGESLKHIEFDCIYCSPLGRAVDTAKYIRGNKNTKIIIKDSLKEMGFGTWEGMERSKIEEQYPTERLNFWNNPHLYKAVDGESFEDLFKRVRKALDEIISNTACENILIVTHTVVIKAIYLLIKNYPLKDFWQLPYIYDTCLTVLEVENKEIKFVLEADVSHLS